MIMGLGGFMQGEKPAAHHSNCCGLISFIASALWVWLAAWPFPLSLLPLRCKQPGLCQVDARLMTMLLQ